MSFDDEYITDSLNNDFSIILKEVTYFALPYCIFLIKCQALFRYYAYDLYFN